MPRAKRFPLVRWNSWRDKAIWRLQGSPDGTWTAIKLTCRNLHVVDRAVLGIECHERFSPPSRKSILANSSKNSLFSFVVASGSLLWLTSATPVGAGWFNFRDHPHYVDWGQSQAPKLHRKPRHEISSRKYEAQREQRRPQGPFQAIVAIASQQVSLYGQDGFIARAPISTGTPAHPTPTGIFTVIAKARWHASNIYSGAPMPYMERITWSGIALHAGPRPGYPASHGCIRLPEDFAVRLFQMTKIGTRVIVTRDAVAPIEITHQKLFVPEKPTEHMAAFADEFDQRRHRYRRYTCRGAPKCRGRYHQWRKHYG